MYQIKSSKVKCNKEKKTQYTIEKNTAVLQNNNMMHKTLKSATMPRALEINKEIEIK